MKNNIVYIPYGSVLTKEQTDTLYEIAKTPIEDWMKLGFTDEEAQELSKASIVYKSETPSCVYIIPTLTGRPINVFCPDDDLEIKYNGDNIEIRGQSVWHRS